MRKAETDVHVQAARFEAGRDESVDEVVIVDGPVQRDFPGGGFRLRRLLHDEGKGELIYPTFVLGGRVRITRAELQFQAFEQIEAELSEDRFGLLRIDAAERVFPKGISRRRADVEFVELVFVGLEERT